MHSDWVLLAIAAISVGACWAVVWLASVAMREARMIAGQFFDLVDDNPPTAPDEPLTESDLVVSRVLPPNNPPPPTPEQAIEGVRKALQEQQQTITSQIPVICYTGQALIDLQEAASAAGRVRDQLLARINASTP